MPELRLARHTNRLSAIICIPFWDTANWSSASVAAIPAAPEVTLWGLATGIATLLVVRRRR